MPQRKSYKQGVPAWVDLTTDDLEASKAFYRQVFGWDYIEVSFGAATYTMATLGGRRVAGLMEQTEEQIEYGPPPRWNAYLAVDDVAGISDEVSELGGHLLMPPVELADAGTMAAIADRSETLVGLWQAGSHLGAEVVNETGSLIWNELVTDDVVAAASFFSDLLGWTTKEIEIPTGPYTLFSVDGETVGGISQRRYDHIKNHWETYFNVASVDDILGAVGQAGGLIDEPTDIGFGKVAPVRDPQGAMFHVMEANDL